MSHEGLLKKIFLLIFPNLSFVYLFIFHLENQLPQVFVRIRSIVQDSQGQKEPGLPSIRGSTRRLLVLILGSCQAIVRYRCRGRERVRRVRQEMERRHISRMASESLIIFLLIHSLELIL